MKKWEYLQINRTIEDMEDSGFNNMAECINEYGNAGWELVTFTIHQHNPNNCSYDEYEFFFKREILT